MTAAWEGVRRVHPGRRQPPVVALDDLTLEAPDGGLLVVVGPSGSGKSTALRTLAGIDPLAAGRVHLAGRDVTEVPAHRREVAMVFQDLALFPHLSVADNVMFGPTIRDEPVAERRRRLAEVADLLDLGDLLNRRPSELSGGQRQRVALGRALVRDPAAFLLDEPLSDLDPQLRHDARAEIVALQRRLGTTMVYVTHDQVEAMTTGDRIAVLREGRLEQVGTPREVYDRPATTFVATFVGSPPMSLLPADAPLVEPGPGAVVGLRAEGVVVAPSRRDGALVGTVLAREDHGSEVVLRTDAPCGEVSVRVGPRDRHAVGDAVGLTMAAEATVHRFDADGRRVV